MTCTCGHLQGNHHNGTRTYCLRYVCGCEAFVADETQPLLCGCGRPLLVETGSVCEVCMAWPGMTVDSEATAAEQGRTRSDDASNERFNDELETTFDF